MSSKVPSKKEKKLTGTNPKAFVDGLHTIFEKPTEEGYKSTIVVLWNLRYDPMFVPPEMEDVKTEDVNGEKHTFHRVMNSICIPTYQKHLYSNYQFFHNLAEKRKPWTLSDWGRNPHHTYYEVDGKIPTEQEIFAIIHNFHTPILGKIKYRIIEDDKSESYGWYQGIEANNLSIRNLPEGWSRHTSRRPEHCGLYYYTKGDVSQWDFPDV